jgi:hypothetical protein
MAICTAGHWAGGQAGCLHSSSSSSSSNSMKINKPRHARRGTGHNLFALFDARMKTNSKSEELAA